MSTPNPIIKFRKVEKRFGQVPVLRQLDLDVADGEKIGLIGPSGSGKSTILRILMTLEEIQNGDVEVDGIPMWTADPSGSRRLPEAEFKQLRKKLGMCFQNFNLFPHLTAIENVTLAPVRVLGLEPNAAQARGNDLLNLVGLAEHAHKFPAQLSGGQQQRVAIARTLAMRPKILLFDEITSALDPETIGEVLDVVRMLARDHSFTILMVTHQMGVVREIADRVLFLEGGRIVEEGPPSEVLTSPQHIRTREFIRAVKQD